MPVCIGACDVGNTMGARLHVPRISKFFPFLSVLQTAGPSDELPPAICAAYTVPFLELVTAANRTKMCPSLLAKDKPF